MPQAKWHSLMESSNRGAKLEKPRKREREVGEGGIMKKLWAVLELFWVD